MNKFTKENVSIAVKNAINAEKLMNKDVAEIFGVSAANMSYLGNEKYWPKIPHKLWNDFQTWMYSGKKLKGYVVPVEDKVTQEILPTFTGTDYAEAAPEPAEPSKTIFIEDTDTQRNVSAEQAEQLAPMKEAKNPKSLGESFLEYKESQLKMVPTDIPPKKSTNQTYKEAEKAADMDMTARMIEELNNMPIERCRPLAPSECFTPAESRELIKSFGLEIEVRVKFKE